jgi:hypothetical protein
MNEIQIIQKQVATERDHFAEVAAACARHLGADGSFLAVCAEYFAFALTRFDTPVAQQLTTLLASGPNAEFLRAFTEASRRHFERLDSMLTQNVLVTEWRAAARIDADSIFAERTRYGRVKTTIPP